MKKFAIFTLALASLTLPSLASAQNRPSGRPDAPATTLAPAPARPAVSTPGTAHEGTIGIDGTWTAADSYVGLGVEYYFDRQFLIRTNLTLNLSGFTETNKTLSPTTSTDTSGATTPQVGLLVTALSENRISPQATWSWGGQLGFGYASKDTTSATTKTSGVLFDVVLGAVLDVKYMVTPGIAFFLQPVVALVWEPVNGITDPSGNSINGVTTTNGTKTSDVSYSSLSLTAKTSAIGVVFYLN
jgi:hypothetical protein